MRASRFHSNFAAPSAQTTATLLACAWLTFAAAAHAEPWTVLPKSPAQCAQVVAFDDKTVLCLFGPDAGQIKGVWKSTDGGETWPNAAAVVVPVPGAVYWRDASTAFVATVGGMKKDGSDVVWKTADGGKTWTVKALASAVGMTQLTSVHCAGAVCYTDGGKQDATGAFVPVIARSTDDGETWTEISVPAGCGKLSTVKAFDAKTAIAVGLKGPKPVAAASWRTTDGGATWQDGGPVTVGMQVVTATVGYAWSEQQGLLKTADAGLTWSPMPMPSTKGVLLRAFHFFDENQGLAAFEKGDLQRTLDGGKSWTGEALPDKWGEPSAVAVASASVSFVSSRLLKFSPSVIRSGTPGAVTATPDAGSTADAGPDAGAADAVPVADTGTDAAKPAASDTAVASDADAAPLDSADAAGSPAAAAAPKDGGGCTASSSPAGFAGWMLAGLALLVVRLRRSPRRLAVG